LKATEENAYDIAQISSDVAKECMVREFTPEELKKILSNEKYYILVGKLGEEVAGYVLSTYSWGKIHILEVAVKKSRRRTGNLHASCHNYRSCTESK